MIFFKHVEKHCTELHHTMGSRVDKVGQSVERQSVERQSAEAGGGNTYINVGCGFYQTGSVSVNS